MSRQIFKIIFNLWTRRKGIRGDKAINLLPDMLSSFTINIAYHANDPNVGLPLTKNPGKYKLFTSDTGIFITLAFKDKKYTDNIIYDRLLSDKLDTNLGYIYENMIAQILASKGYNLLFSQRDALSISITSLILVT